MSDDRFDELLERLLEAQLSEAEQRELAEHLRSSPTARQIYWETMHHDVLLHDVVREAAGRDLARLSLTQCDTDDGLLHGVHRSGSLNDVAEPLIHGEYPGAKSRFSAPSATSRVLHRLSPVALCGWLAGATLLALGLIAAVNRSGVRSAAVPSVERITLASLRSLSGDVWSVPHDASSAKARSGAEFATGDAIEVGAEGNAEVLLRDGSRIMLGAESLLRFESSDATPVRLHLERGGADVDATPQAPEHPLIFTTEQARLTVLGTRFRLYAGGEDSRVELEEGSVRFERQSDGQSVEVEAGQSAVASGEIAPDQPIVVQPLRTAWKLRHTLLRAGERVAFSHQGTQLATSNGSQIKVWDVATGTVQHELTKIERMERLAFTPLDDAIVAINDSGQIIVWPFSASSDSQARHSLLKPDRGTLRRSAVSQDGRWIAQTTSDAGGHLPIWHVDDAGVIARANVLPMKASTVEVMTTPLGPQVVASAWDGTTVKWDAATGDELARLRFPLQLHVMALSQDGRLLSGFGNNAGLVLVDFDVGRQQQLWPAGSVQVRRLLFSQQASTLVAAMDDGIVRAWSVLDGEPRFVLATDHTKLHSLDLSTDGRWLAVSGEQGRVSVWQLETEPVK